MIALLQRLLGITRLREERDRYRAMLVAVLEGQWGARQRKEDAAKALRHKPRSWCDTQPTQPRQPRGESNVRH